jgi:glycosyltransferase involved in cell wall biosynthesis
MSEQPCYGVVAIARNEGCRLKKCLESAAGARAIVYVDSGSTDGSVEWAKSRGIEVVELDLQKGFTAGRARNAGFARMREKAPHLEFLQFVDGDCELNGSWPEYAVAYLTKNPTVCAVYGRRRERHPERSIYNRICDKEWDLPIGEATLFGGDVMIRASALAKVGGYRDDFIAGEEPELSFRLRAAGWAIWRIDHEMTLHDAAILRFRQWWLRMVRSGYAFAQGRHLYRSSLSKMWVRESRRAWIWGLAIPLAATVGVFVVGPIALAILLIYPAQLLRRIPRQPGPWRDRIKFTSLEVLSRFAEVSGLIRFMANTTMGKSSKIIEYK